MELKHLKKIIFTTLIIVMCVTSPASMSIASAATDIESSTYGFSVDLNYFYKPIWYTTVTTNCYYNGKLIGVCTTNIGIARARSKASDGQYMDNVFVRCTMKGKYPTKNYCGYSDELTIASTLPTSASLMAYSPTQLATETSYTLGIEANNDKTVGISASTTITKKALDIDSYSDTSARLYKTTYTYNHPILRWNWALSKYSYNESIQKAHYVMKTGSSKYKALITVSPRFERFDMEPCYSASTYLQHIKVNHNITLTTPY